MKYFLMIVTAMVVSMTLNSTAVVEKSEVNVTGSSEQIQPEEKRQIVSLCNGARDLLYGTVETLTKY